MTLFGTDGDNLEYLRGLYTECWTTAIQSHRRATPDPIVIDLTSEA